MDGGCYLSYRYTRADANVPDISERILRSLLFLYWFACIFKWCHKWVMINPFFASMCGCWYQTKTDSPCSITVTWLSWVTAGSLCTQKRKSYHLLVNLINLHMDAQIAPNNIQYLKLACLALFSMGQLGYLAIPWHYWKFKAIVSFFTSPHANILIAFPILQDSSITWVPFWGICITRLPLLYQYDSQEFWSSTCFIIHTQIQTWAWTANSLNVQINTDCIFKIYM